MKIAIRVYLFSFLFFVLMLSVENAHSKTKLGKSQKIDNDCIVSRWPYSQSLNDQDFHKFADIIDRKILVHYFFHELVSGKSASLGNQLVHYLYATETNQNLKGLWALLEDVSELKINKIKKLDKKELCEVYSNTLKME